MINLVYFICMTSENKQNQIPTARLLLDAFRAFENHLAGVLTANGFTDVTTGNFNVLRHLNPEGIHLSALARDAQISKQAIGKMIKEIEAKGYVEVIPDPSDGRAKFVRFTARGEKMISLARDIVGKMEESYRSLLGQNAYNQLRQSVADIQQWHLNKEI